MSRASERESDKIEMTIERAWAFLDSAADCIYPKAAGDIDTLRRIREATNCPINVYASASTAPMHEL